MLLIVNGHYHRSQWITQKGKVPVFCPGSPLQHSWVDMDDPNPRGFCVVDIKINGPDVPPATPEIRLHHIQTDHLFPRFYSAPCDAYREGFDFLREDLQGLKDLKRAEAVIHKNVEGVSSNEVLRAAVSYLRQQKPDADATELTQLLKVGLPLLRKGKANTEGAQR